MLKMEFNEARINGFSFFVRPNAFWESFNASWEADTKAFYRRHTHPGKSVLDIGAWIGPTVLTAYANNAKHIYAVEADPCNFHILKNNCALNNIADKVTLINRCIYINSGEVISFGKEFDQGDSSTKTFSFGDEGVKVLTSTLTDLIKDNNIKVEELCIVKIDIEGSEALLIDDLIKLAEYKDLCVFLAMHPCFWPERKKVAASFAPAFVHYDLYDKKEQPLDLEGHLRLALSSEAYDLILKPKR